MENNNCVANFEQVMKQNNFFQKYNLNRVGILGSAARGEEANDIDILIEDDINYRELAQFRNELEAILNIRIDLVMSKYANPIVLYRARRDLVYISKH